MIISVFLKPKLEESRFYFFLKSRVEISILCKTRISKFRFMLTWLEGDRFVNFFISRLIENLVSRNGIEQSKTHRCKVMKLRFTYYNRLQKNINLNYTFVLNNKWSFLIKLVGSYEVL